MVLPPMGYDTRGNQETDTRVAGNKSTRARARDALRMRFGGASFDQIADALGYEGRSGAWKATRRALRESAWSTSG